MSALKYEKRKTCPPEACDTFQFMSKQMGLSVLHPGGLRETRRLLQRCKIETGYNILDLGCGSGSTSNLIAETYRCNVTGVDIDDELLSVAEQNSKKRNLDDLTDFKHGDIESLPFDDNVFDGAIAQAVLVFTDKEKALQEISRVVKPRGFLGVIELTWKEPPSNPIARKVKDTLCSVSLEAELHEEWITSIQKAGFTVIYNDLMGLKFDFLGMLRDEGLRNVIKLIRKYFNPDTRKRLNGFSGLFKETDKYLGYGVYIGRAS